MFPMPEIPERIRKEQDKDKSHRIKPMAFLYKTAKGDVSVLAVFVELPYFL